MRRADYQLRHGLLGKVGTMWSRQVDADTRGKARAITEVSGCSDILRDTDTIARYATTGGRIVADNLSFLFVDGNFATTGRNPSDYTHVTAETPEGTTVSLALPAELPTTLPTPTPTKIAQLDEEFLAAIADAVLPVGDWFLIPIPHHITPIVIESATGAMLISGIDFSAHPGYIATRLSPAEIFHPGLVRVVTAYMDLPQPHSFVLGAPVSRRGSKFLIEYARKSQSLVAFRRAAAEYCGMYVFPEPDVILGSVAVGSSVVYVTASAGALRIDYPHGALKQGDFVDAGYVVSPLFEVWSEFVSPSVSLLTRLSDAGASISLDGALPVKGIYVPQHNKILLDYVDTDPVSGKPHVRIHLDGDPAALAALWERQRQHELATGEFLYDQFFSEGVAVRSIPFDELMLGYYGPQLAAVLYGGLPASMEALLLRFVSEHRPAGCVMLTASVA